MDTIDIDVIPENSPNSNEYDDYIDEDDVYFDDDTDCGGKYLCYR